MEPHDKTGFYTEELICYSVKKNNEDEYDGKISLIPQENQAEETAAREEKARDVNSQNKGGG